MLSWERMLVSVIRDAEREGSLKPQGLSFASFLHRLLTSFLYQFFPKDITQEWGDILVVSRIWEEEGYSELEAKRGSVS